MSKSQTIFPGIPFVESPLFAADLEQSALSPWERDVAIQLSTRGFAVLDFPDADIGARIDRIRTRLSPVFGISEERSPDAPPLEGMRVQDAWRYDEDVLAIAANDVILELLSKLYGRRAFPFQTLNFPVGTQQALHTDAVHFSSIPERFMCGVWLAMEDVGPNSGPLTYVPGSHRWPIMSNGMIGRRGWQSQLDSAQDPYGRAWDALIEAHGVPQETFQARKGQALIWSANLLHGGSSRLDPQLTRWSQVTHYYFDDCIYYTPAFSDEPLGRLALRNIVDVSTGKKIPNRYLDEEIELPQPVVQPSAPRWLRRIRKRFRGLFGRSVPA